MEKIYECPFLGEGETVRRSGEWQSEKNTIVDSRKILTAVGEVYNIIIIIHVEEQ